MSFEVSTDAYGAFMGRFSTPLAQLFADALEVHAGQSALDVGCGTGVLTDALVQRLGLDHVSAVDPSPPFVEGMLQRFPDMDVRLARAEDLPHPTDRFDVVLAQLVVHFMRDPVAGLREMARVTRPGGVVGANVWDHSAGGAGPLETFWSAVRSIDPRARDESQLPGSSDGHLADLFAQAGMPRSTSTTLTVELAYPSFEEWWHPYTLGVGPAGDYVAGLTDAAREALRERCRSMLPEAPFTIRATAWTVWASPPA